MSGTKNIIKYAEENFFNHTITSKFEIRTAKSSLYATTYSELIIPV